ncbi:MAG: GGDEF domain-containing protein [Candidatus Dormibacteraeota bacterium]|nr:GGDEF domain-containing protein [Candidatus Dormibacteraeota bacterium]
MAGLDPEVAGRLGAELGLPAQRLAGLDPELAGLIDARLTRLRDLAALDDLTGVLRRGAGMEALQREVRRAQRLGDDRLTLVFLDLIGLKQVNDEEGHGAGDTVLRELAAALRRRLRGYDLVLRWGGDEFVCAISHTGSGQAERILSEVEADFRSRTGHSFRLGVAEVRPDDEAATLVARADHDLYTRALRGSGRERAGESRQNRQGRSAHSPA